MLSDHKVNLFSRPQTLALLLCLPMAGLLSCDKEERSFRVDPASATTFGERSDRRYWPATQRAVIESFPPQRQRYETNAYGLSEGQRLFSSFNCVGCHAHGGGGIGPALMDDRWIHGSQPQAIFQGIVDGWP